ncbi:hypothetical protein RRG08_059073 [Elysia crispata]|uniref:Uncharacterized protein n=1 Tax=Elysia crispata TaxID=231223 RepID=A0AAE1B9F2_9GAST|nr:hypothetical protein RRG08_059073 [Elysia crispata]
MAALKAFCSTALSSVASVATTGPRTTGCCLCPPKLLASFIILVDVPARTAWVVISSRLPRIWPKSW